MREIQRVGIMMPKTKCNGSIIVSNDPSNDEKIVNDGLEASKVKEAVLYNRDYHNNNYCYIAMGIKGHPMSVK